MLAVLVTINEIFFIFILLNIFIVITPILEKISARNAKFCKKVYFLERKVKNIKIMEIKSVYLREVLDKRLSAPDEANRRLFFSRRIHLPATIYLPVYRMARHTSI